MLFSFSAAIVTGVVGIFLDDKKTLSIAATVIGIALVAAYIVIIALH
jgi:hypothetical protein